MGISHERKRQIEAVFLKKIKFSPIVSVQGPRQCGKSYFAKNLIPQKVKKTQYLTFDNKETRSFADQNPNSFLRQNEEMILIIDEVQKVPDIFDEMKALVDSHRKPGQFIILGSTEFSHETQIRESLTGRLSRVRLYPMNLSETLKKPLNSVSGVPFVNKVPRTTRAELMRYLKNGGLPGIFGVKSDEERNNLFADWISLTVERDIHQIKRFKLDPGQALEILRAVSDLEEPTAANICKNTKLNPKKLNSYLLALKTLFVIFEIRPFKGSTGKSQYFLTDVGLLDYFKASFHKKLRTWFYLEIYSQLSCKGIASETLTYYRSSKGSIVDLIYTRDKKMEVVKLIPSEKYDERDFLIFNTLKNKYAQEFDIKLTVLNGASQKLKGDGFEIYPWESIA